MSESQLPFNNIYRKREVAENESKACAICFKHTNSVLITLNSKDWFYVCVSHLKDKGFATIVQISNDGEDMADKYKELKLKLAEIEKNLKRLQKIKEDKNSQLNRFKEYIWNKEGTKEVDEKEKKKGTENDDEKEGEGEGEKNMQKLDDKTKKDNELNRIEINEKIKTLNEEHKEIKKTFESFEKKYSKFKLDKVFFRNRLLLNYKKQRRVEIQKNLENGSLFPSINKLPELPKPKS